MIKTNVAILTHCTTSGAELYISNLALYPPKCNETPNIEGSE